MKRSEILRRLKACESEIRARFGVERLGLFGSAARDQLAADSDVDILVKFAGPERYDNYLGLRATLEQLL